MSHLCHEFLEEKLGTAFCVQTYDVVDSTNTLAREAAVAGAPEGTVILAERQRFGRGRMGRNFFSPSGTGLYMSLVLRPSSKISPLYITSAAAVAVAQAIEDIAGIPTGIKWVNDVYCREKKVCGILTEGAFDGTSSQLCYAILGIGVNVFSPSGGFPDDIKERAGAIFDAETHLPAHTKEELVIAILKRFLGYYGALSDKAFLKPYRSRDLLKNKPIEVLNLDGSVLTRATALGITDDFALKICGEDGIVSTVSSGEVSVRL